jgi:hypothetical protein
VDGLGQKHEQKRQDEREDVDPDGIPEKLIAKNADERTADVPSEERARLGGRYAGEAEKKDGRATE